jgi:CheY-like chemotaxis protein
MTDLAGRRIFIVEDHPANMAIAKTLLERNGALVEYERWGFGTQEKLAKFAPVDLILLDLMLPKSLSGFDLFTHIRSLEGCATVPIVAYSASNPSEAIPKAQAMGFAGYIAKPLDYDAFAGQIEQILNGKSVWVAR